METLIHKILEVQVPVWENNVMTDAKEPRVMVVFKRQKSALGGLKTFTEFGRMFLDRGITLDQAQSALAADADYSDTVDLVDRDENGFYRAVLK